MDGARKNLNAEIKDWNFDTVRVNAGKLWEKELSKVDVEGGTLDQQKVFYTALYHTMVTPNVNMDVDGQYRGRDMKIHKAENFTNYTVFSLWDTYRACNPLYTILEPQRANDFINTFLVQYEQGGLLPVWELSGNETMCMIGYHSVPVIVDAYMKGINNFDKEEALKAMKNSAEKDQLGLKDYMQYGYVPGDIESESVSKTLEYAYDDWCIAQFAKATGHDDDYKTYIKRAQYYKNLVDPETKLMRARVNGAWLKPFDPTEINIYYTEANAWQYSFYAPQDYDGLIKLYGGKDKLEAKLHELFTTDTKTTGKELPDVSGLIGQYAHGNEPSHHIAYLFNYVGQPWATQEYVHKVEKEFYPAKPDGLIGNEDCGQMSAWYVLSAMGFYPVTPCSNTYVIGTPVFPKLTINLDNGKKFTVIANNVSDKNFYIRSVKLNGQPYPKSYIRHEDLMKGGEMVFEMGDIPNKQWGTKNEDMPSTSINDNLITTTPYLTSGKNVFRDSTVIKLGTTEEGAKIYYTLDGKEPALNSTVFDKPILIKDTKTLKAIAYKEGKPQSCALTVEFKKLTKDIKVKYNSAYDKQFSAGGDQALVDLLRGGKDARMRWQGFEGKDFDVVLDLGKSQSVKSVSTGFMQSQGDQIFYPTQVDYYSSEDGINFKPLTTLKGEAIRATNDISIKDYSAKVNAKARYIKVVGKSIITCPKWHPGSGSKAWLFVDEITVG